MIILEHISKEKNEKLGMNFSTASNRLRKLILFQLVKRLNLDKCCRCNEPIISEGELSIEHIKPWLYESNARELYFDLNNISFSHRFCNYSNSRKQLLINSSTGYKGVSFVKDKHRNKPFKVTIFLNAEKPICIGYFETAEEAANYYDEYAISLFGENVVTNKYIHSLKEKFDSYKEMSRQEIIKAELGMSYSKASNILLKMILFELCERLELNTCFQCNLKISNLNDFSIEHKQSWGISDNPVEMFFNLDNIAFSHLKCNVSAPKHFLNTNKVGFRGVIKRKNGWISKIIFNGEKLILGPFSDPIEAAKAYDLKAIEFYGDKAVTNKSLGLI